MSGERKMESHQGGPMGGGGGGGATQLRKGRDRDGEEVGKAYRNLPALLGEIRLHILQCHHRTLSAVRGEEVSRRSAVSQRPEQLGCYQSHAPSCLSFLTGQTLP